MKARARDFRHAGAMTRHDPENGPTRLTATDPRFWTVLALALVFLALGALFLAVPGAGALIYGIPEPAGSGRLALRAIGARDAALALYLAGLAAFASARAVAIVLTGSLVIPACDLVLILAAGTAAWWQVALHGASAGVLALTALWLGRPGAGSGPARPQARDAAASPLRMRGRKGRHAR
ncbi:DUF4267 domain-containing protein [Methylobacterium platani]|uniref:DUF4267 domain-containing protein n=1 Tax=Methylobacterium platani TaxID=427683 RepID=UPI001FD8F1F1|nr:DUF4267 domain-containing protein [Methylobacterium platani]